MSTYFPSTESKAFILYHDNKGESLKELNALLQDRWTIVHSCPMPNSPACASCDWPTVRGTCLVVLQRPSAI